MLLVAEEDVSMIDESADLLDVDLTQSALAFAAVVHHFGTGCLQRVKDRLVAFNHDLEILCRHADGERLSGMGPCGSEWRVPHEPVRLVLES
ncbi:hypothetical protein GCWB2_11255 [Gordonia rubripertincta]|nr:hypothetical protein GCWB2_11255 [Gordonia rubripertincta]